MELLFRWETLLLTSFPFESAMTMIREAPHLLRDPSKSMKFRTKSVDGTDVQWGIDLLSSKLRDDYSRQISNKL